MVGALCAASDLWVGRVMRAVKQVERVVIDLGSELYPPMHLDEDDCN